MKFTGILLSVILLLLSCIPCADVENSFDTKNTISENHSNHNDKHLDLCSPFCICNCCGIQIVNFTLSDLIKFAAVASIYTNRQQITYKSHLASMFSGSIWQPPQIV